MLGYRRGDTIVEVLFAVAVFSLVAVGALSLLTQGSAASQRALESTLVRQQMDAQAETLRFMHDSYVARYQSGMTYDTTDGTTSPAEEWYKLVQYVKAADAKSATPFGECPENPPAGSFFVDPQTSRVVFSGVTTILPTETWAQLDRSGSAVVSRGLWVEAVRSATSSDTDQANVGYIDFHIMSCWDAPGLSSKMHLATIVRLYDPRG